MCMTYIPYCKPRAKPNTILLDTKTGQIMQIGYYTTLRAIADKLSEECGDWYRYETHEDAISSTMVVARADKTPTGD